MDTGVEEPAIIVEPIEDPFDPVEAPEPDPLPVEEPVPV